MSRPPRSRASSPLRRSTTPLPDIPEVTPTPSPPQSMPTRMVTPGPNAFAQQAARVDKHRQEGNAFYQQQVAEMKRRVTPPTPTAVHPAFRSRPQFHAEQSLQPSTAVFDARDSTVTTMSPFLNAEEKAPPTPPLKLVPEDSFGAHPTDRGYIEEKRERTLHQCSGSDVDRTPVYHPTPKIPSSEFSKSVDNNALTPKKKKGDHVESSAGGDQFKTPRKGFLDKLRFPTSRNNPASASTTSLPPGRGYGGGENMPPKAKAVLSSSPHQAKLARSPSKKKNESTFFSGIKSSFSRKSTDVTSQDVVSPDAPTPNIPDSAAQVPQTGLTQFSDPSYDGSGQSNRVVSQAHSERTRGGDKQQRLDDACGVTRSQSLQYFDRKIPPTPPAKDTPPREKERKPEETDEQKRSREIMEHHAQMCEQRWKDGLEDTQKGEMVQTRSSKLTSSIRGGIFDNDTPTRETVKLIGQDGRLSPTKFGGYANKDVPTLIKQPSVHSMHGSFFPDLQDEHTFQEVKKRTDGLGLEGLSEVPEKLYDQDPKFIYSPSQYSTDWSSIKGESSILGSPNVAMHAGMFKPSPSLPTMLDGHSSTPSIDSLQNNKGSNSSIQTITTTYHSSTAAGSMHHASYSDTHVPLPDPKGTSELIGTPRLVADLLSQPVPDVSLSPPSHICLTPRDTESILDQPLPDVTLSPPLYSCPSAVPSPLQYLPATTYTPPPRKKKNNPDAEVTPTPETTVTQRPQRKKESEKTEAIPSSRRKNKQNVDLEATPKASRAENIARLRQMDKDFIASAPPWMRSSSNTSDNLPMQRKKKAEDILASPESGKVVDAGQFREIYESILATSPTKAKRTSTSPFDNLPSLAPDLESPTPSSSPAAGLSSQHTKPQKQERLASPTSTADDPAATEQQISLSSDKIEQMLRRIESQQSEIVTLRTDLQKMVDLVTTQRAGSVTSPSSVGGGSVVSTASSESRPTTSSTVDDNNDNYATKPADSHTTSSPLPAYVPEGLLDQMGLYHRYFHERVEPILSRHDWDDLDRHENSENMQRRLTAQHVAGYENQFLQALETMNRFADEMKASKREK